MTIPFKFSSLVFYGMTGLMAFFLVVSLMNALSWINKPFAGFLTYHPPYVGSLGLKEWPGTRGGLKYLDRIVSVDGRPVQKGRDIVDAASQRAPGTLVRYAVESGGKVHEI